jgi:PRTRC genetic system protein C
MLITNQLPRVFLFDNEGQQVKLSDPDSKMTPESTLNFYSQTYPLLTTAKIEGPEIVDDTVQYKFVSTLGTKG